MTDLSLRSVDRIEILTLIDNISDLLLPSEERVERLSSLNGNLASDPLRAEHGYSALVTLYADDSKHTLLFDTGLSADALLHNMNLLDISPDQIETILLSHGHADHTQGLSALLTRIAPRPISIHMHPDALLERRLALPEDKTLTLPALPAELLSKPGVNAVFNREPLALFDGLALLTGEIPRKTAFEKGFPPHQALIDGEWKSDASVADDQALVMLLRDKGLVVLTGCGHAGIINTLNYALELGEDAPLHAVLGGFHLGGALFEKIIDPTVAALVLHAPATIIPGHCTGWKATQAIATAMPDAFLPNSVGSNYIFQ